MTNRDFCDFIQNIRLERNLTLSEVSSSIMIHRSTYAHYEKGDRVPPVEIILRLSNLYEINPMDLFYLLASEEVKEKNKSFIHYRHNQLSTYNRNELELIQSIRNLSASNQVIIHSLINALSSNECNQNNSNIE